MVQNYFLAQCRPQLQCRFSIVAVFDEICHRIKTTARQVDQISIAALLIFGLRLVKWDPPAGNGNDPRPPTNGTNGKPPAQKKTLTLRELAYYLNCSPSSIYYAMRRGWLPARVEEFGQKRFDLDEVLEWLRRPGPPAGR